MENQQQSTLPTIEAKMLRYQELTNIVNKAKEEQELIKGTLMRYFKEHHLNEHRVGLDGNFDVKATIGESRRTKVDTEQLSHDLGISETSAKQKEVLMKAVQDGKLTIVQYEGYKYTDVTETISLRKVKA